MSDGGEGVSGLTWKMSDEDKLVRSAQTKSQWQDKSFRAKQKAARKGMQNRLGKKMPIGFGDNVRERMKGNKFAIGNANATGERSVEQCLRISEGVKKSYARRASNAK